LVELTIDTIEDVFVSIGRNKKVQKHKRTSAICKFFDLISGTGDDKLNAKCNLCGITYLAPSTYGIGNMKRHMETCLRRDTRDVGQMLISGNQGYMSVSSSKFCLKKFRELLVASVIKHDLPF